MSLIGNILWILLGGLPIAFSYLIGGLLVCATIVGIPFGIQILRLGIATFWPFGKSVRPVQRPPGCVGTVLTIVWLIVFGLTLAVGHLILALALCITIIGIPFAKQHFKLMQLSLLPLNYELK